MSRLLSVTLTAALIAAGGAVAAETTALEVMKVAVDPASKAFWAGGNDPPENETEAQAAARWIAAAKGAETLQAAAVELASPAVSRPGRWNEYARMMGEAAKAGAPAMAARDMDKAFEAGGQLYEACDGCHKTYVPRRE